MVAADLFLHDCGKTFEIANGRRDIFCPSALRFAFPRRSSEGFEDFAARLLREIFSMPDEEAASIQPGHGGICEYKGEKLGSSGMKRAGCTKFPPSASTWDASWPGIRRNEAGIAHATAPGSIFMEM